MSSKATAEEENLEAVRRAFARQASTFDAWAVTTDAAAGARFTEALGAAATGHLLDVACGPGVISAALAPRAATIVALDATDAMLDKARARCAGLGIHNVEFARGDAHDLPFETGRFDGVVCRLALHHFSTPARAVAEMARVLKPGGSLAIADIVTADNAADADLQNAIEILRDPSHVAMLSESKLVQIFEGAGLGTLRITRWVRARDFHEWMGIVNDPSRSWPLKTLLAALIEAGRDAGMQLHNDDERITFQHHWRLIAGRKD
jgi:ubiquinone/menaquinone biosynthesis C-methylase UbiE